MSVSVRAVATLLALLTLAACDANAPEVSVLDVEAPAALPLGDLTEITATLTNTTGDDLYLGKPGLVLYRQPEGGYDWRDVPLEQVYSPIITLELRPNIRIRPGETVDLGLTLDLRPNGLLLGSGYVPVDGTYHVRATLYTTPGTQGTLYRGRPASDAVALSAPFSLAFTER